MAKAKKQTEEKKTKDFKEQTAELAQSPEPTITEEVIEKEEVVETEEAAVKKVKNKPNSKPQEEVFIDSIKSTRVGLDGMIQCAKLAFGDQSPVVRNLFYGKAWLGKVLASYGCRNPYITESPIKHKGEIPKTADVFENTTALRTFENLDLIQKVLYLRERLADTISIIESMDGLGGREGAIARTNAYNKLSEARFDLGDILAKIREA